MWTVMIETYVEITGDLFCGSKTKCCALVRPERMSKARYGRQNLLNGRSSSQNMDLCKVSYQYPP